MAETVYCTNHPSRETLLRCNRCSKPICPECAVRHPVGLRCADCAQLRPLPQYALAPRHYLLGGAAGLASSTAAGFLASLLGGIPFGLWITILLGPAAGWFVARAIDSGTGFKRGTAMAAVGAGSVVAGYLLATWIPLALILSPVSAALASPVRLLTNPAGIFYILLAAATAVANLRQ